jgi:hypothetical protein
MRGSRRSAALLLHEDVALWHAVVGNLVVAVGGIVLMIMRRSNVDNAARHAAEHHGVPPLDETLDYGPAS